MKNLAYFQYGKNFHEKNSPHNSRKLLNFIPKLITLSMIAENQFMKAAVNEIFARY